MIAIHLCDNKEIDNSSENFKNMVSESVKNYVLNNFNDVVKCDKFDYCDSDYPEEYPYRIFVTIKL